MTDPKREPTRDLKHPYCTIVGCLNERRGHPRLCPDHVAESEDAALLAAIKRCRELGVVPMGMPSGRWRVAFRPEYDRDTGRWRVAFRPEYDRGTLPEAVEAYEAAQRPKVSRDDALEVIAMSQCPREPECPDTGDCITEWCSGCVARLAIGPECPPPPGET